jgi:DNA polymerase (family 10)
LEKRQAGRVLKEIGALLELLGENPFKTRAYQGAVRALEKDPRTLDDLLEGKELGKLKGIGKAIEEKIRSFAAQGHLPYLEELRELVPEGLHDLLRIPGLGPKKVRVLWQELGIQTLLGLEYVCQKDQLANLKGFGAKTQTKILEGIRFLRSASGQSLLCDVLEVGLEIEAQTQALPGVERVALAGSLRRRSPIVKDIDLVVASGDGEALSQILVQLEGVEQVIMQGPSRTSVRWKGSLGVDWKIVAPESYPSALAHFTGSKEHNIRLRQRAKERNLSLNEYGLTDPKGMTQKLGSEQALYKALDLAFVPPEMREDLGEIEAAAQGPLPKLLQEEDLQGVLHLHTTRSDGANDLRTMALAAMELGFQYLGVTDHSRTAVYASGLSIEELAAQREEIQEIEKEDLGIRILQGVESDILPDGSLDYPDEVLAQLDFVIGSVHSAFQLSEEAMTARLLKAMDNPYLDMLGHLTGRILLHRKSFSLNMEKILARAGETGVVIEINASPNRLDLDYHHIPRARELGVRFSINPDAHSRKGLEDTIWGVHVARKGGVTSQEVLNTLPVEDFLAGLRRHRRD